MGADPECWVTFLWICVLCVHYTLSCLLRASLCIDIFQDFFPCVENQKQSGVQHGIWVTSKWLQHCEIVSKSSCTHGLTAVCVNINGLNAHRFVLCLRSTLVKQRLITAIENLWFWTIRILFLGYIQTCSWKNIFVEDMGDLIYWLSYSASQMVLFISIAVFLNRNPRLPQQAQAMKFFYALFSPFLNKFVRNLQTKHF